MEKYQAAYINPDEPIEVRRNKAAFRMIAFKARSDGKTVTFRKDWIQIDGITYYVSDLDKIPEAYKVSANNSENPTKPDGEKKKNPTPNIGQKIKEGPFTRRNPTSREQIKLTKAGYTYAWKTACLSHFYNCDFTYKSTSYTSFEQGLHHIHPTHENELEIAEAIMSLDKARDIKQVAKDLPYSDEWNAMCPGVLMDLNIAKFDQNPDLMQLLINTAPHKLVEATVDAKIGDIEIVSFPLLKHGKKIIGMINFISDSFTWLIVQLLFMVN